MFYKLTGMWWCWASTVWCQWCLVCSCLWSLQRWIRTMSCWWSPPWCGLIRLCKGSQKTPSNKPAEESCPKWRQWWQPGEENNHRCRQWVNMTWITQQVAKTTSKLGLSIDILTRFRLTNLWFDSILILIQSELINLEIYQV